MEQQQPTNNNPTSPNTLNTKPQQHTIQQAFTFSQFINTIKITTSQQDFKLLKPLSSLSNTSEQIKSLTSYHFRQLAIHCYHLKIVPVPQDDQKFICYSYEGGNVCLCLNQFVHYDDSVIKDYQTLTPYFVYYKNFISAIHTFWKSSQQQAQKQSKREHLTADYFMNKLNLLLSQSSQINKQQLTSQKQAFSTFQKQQIFIQTSILLRINRSALVCVIRRSQQLMELYAKHRMIEEQLSEEYNERRKRKNNVEKVLQTEKIFKKISNSFLYHQRKIQSIIRWKIREESYKSIQLQMKSETFFNKNINKINQSYQKLITT